MHRIVDRNENHVGPQNKVNTNPKTSPVYKNIWSSIRSQQLLTEVVSGWEHVLFVSLVPWKQSTQPRYQNATQAPRQKFEFLESRCG